jgi:putative oxidoreductase
LLEKAMRSPYAHGFLYSIIPRVAPFTAPAIRVYAGLALISHGYPKLFGATMANAAFFESAGFRPGLLWAIVVGLTEVVGGLCLAAGLFTRAAAVPILIFMASAVVYHSRFGFYWNARGFEYPLFWALVVFHFLVHGGGRWSLDAHWKRRKATPAVREPVI